VRGFNHVIDIILNFGGINFIGIKVLQNKTKSLTWPQFQRKEEILNEQLKTV